MTEHANGQEQPRLSKGALVEVELAALGAAFVGTPEESHRVLSETSDAHYTGVRETVFRALRLASVDGTPDATVIATTLRGWKAPANALDVLREAASWPTAAGLDKTLALLEEARLRRDEVSWANRIAGAEGDEARITLLRKAREELNTPVKERVSTLAVTNFRDILKDQTPEPEWFVPGLVGRRRLTLLTAAPKTGKSLASLGLAIRLAAGMGGEWLGTRFPIAVGLNVLYLCAEGGAPLLRKRHAALSNGLTDSWQSRLDVVIARPWPHFDTDAGLRLLRGALSTRPYDAVFIDPLARFRDLEGENDNAVTQILAEGLRAVTEDYNVATTLVHHPSKASASDREGTTFGGGRGASALLGEVDVAISLRKDPNHPTDIRAYFELRETEPIDPGRRLALNKDTLWLDYKGDLGAGGHVSGKPKPGETFYDDNTLVQPLSAVPGEWLQRDVWAARIGCSPKTLKRAIDDGLLGRFEGLIQTDQKGTGRAYRHRWVPTS